MNESDNMEGVFRLYASHYYNLGFNVTCITDYAFDIDAEGLNEETERDSIKGEISSKSPNHKWFHLKVRRQNRVDLDNLDWGFASGIGTVLGFNDLRAIDVDNCVDFNIIENFLHLLNLPVDYEWVIKSGSGKGFHILFYSDGHEYPVSYNQNKAFKGREQDNTQFFQILELRWMGHLVLPPSEHRSGLEYTYLSKRLPNQPPKRVGIEHVKLVVERYCSDEKITGASGTFLDYGHSKISHNISLIDDDLQFQYEKPYYLFLDTETTGLVQTPTISKENAEDTPRLVQIAWLIEDKNGKQIERCNFLVKPSQFRIPEESIKIHKIENNIAYEHGVEIEQILLSFRNRVGLVDYIVGHNVEFDITILKSEYHRYAIWQNLDHVKKLCTMRLSLEVDKSHFRNKYPKLEELYYFLFSKKHENAHNALEDTIATSHCFRNILYRLNNNAGSH